MKEISAEDKDSSKNMEVEESAARVEEQSTEKEAAKVPELTPQQIAELEAKQKELLKKEAEKTKRKQIELEMKRWEEEEQIRERMQPSKQITIGKLTGTDDRSEKPTL